MKTNTKIKTGDKTNVRQKVIDFSTIDTKDRDDDKVWNSMKFYGESDSKEASYRSPKRVSREAIVRIKARRVGLNLTGILRAA